MRGINGCCRWRMGAALLAVTFVASGVAVQGAPRDTKVASKSGPVTLKAATGGDLSAVKEVAKQINTIGDLTVLSRDELGQIEFINADQRVAPELPPLASPIGTTYDVDIMLCSTAGCAFTQSVVTNLLFDGCAEVGSAQDVIGQGAPTMEESVVTLPNGNLAVSIWATAPAATEFWPGGFLIGGAPGDTAGILLGATDPLVWPGGGILVSGTITFTLDGAVVFSGGLAPQDPWTGGIFVTLGGAAGLGWNDVHIDLEITKVPAPDGDEPGTCKPVGDGVYTGTTTDNTGTVDDSSCGSGDTVDEWYCYVAPLTGEATASLCAGAGGDSVIAVYDACTGLEIACNDDFCGLLSEATFPVTANNTYHVRIAGWSGGTVDYTLTLSSAIIGVCGNGIVEGLEQCDDGDTISGNGCENDCTLTPVPPVNDNCIDKIIVTDGTTPFDSTNATTDGAASCGLLGSDIWYNYVATCDGDVTIDVCGSSFDTALAVYAGCACPPTTELACNDDSCGLQSSITLSVTTGTCLKIQVGGFNGATGTGELHIGCVACPTRPANDDCASVTPTALTSGVPVTFTGDNTCSTVECASFPTGTHVWEAITLPNCMDVTLDYCGTVGFGNAWLNLALGCPCATFTAAGTFDSITCGDGNVTITWTALAAGTYYYPVLTEPGSEGPYTINVTGTDCPGTACCVPGVGCSVLDSFACAAAGGTSLVDPSCGLSTCVTTVCCLGDGSCDPAVANDVACIGLGGTPQYGAADCTTVSCPQPAPANDECVDAALITDNTSITADNTTATDAASDPDPTCDVRLFNSIWYKWVATSTSVSITTDNSVAPADDSTYAVYEGTCGALVEVGCSADEGVGFLGNICITGLTVGNTYTMQFGSWATADVGPYTVDIASPCPICGDGIVSGGEQCDDANTISGDGCNADCTLPILAPPNDLCVDKITISDGITAFTTLGASTDGPPHAACLAFGTDQVGQDVWYNYIATCTGTLTVSTCNDGSPASGDADFDTRIAVYGGTPGACACAVDDNNLLVCNDDGTGCAGFSSIATTNVTSGQCYKIRVGGFGGATGSGNLSVACVAGGACCDAVGACTNAPDAGSCAGTFTSGVDCASFTCPPANDECVNAEAKTLGTVAGSNINATDDGDGTFCGTSYSGPSVWYSITGTGTTMTVSTCNDGDPTTGSADYDTKLQVFTDCADLAGSCVGGNDDGVGCTGFSSSFSWCAAAGTTYYVRVYGFGGGTGNFVLANNDDGIACGPPVNDNCIDKLPLLDGTTAFDTTNATTDGAADALCDFFGDNQVQGDIWYNYTATCTGTVTIDTCAAGGDSKLAIYDGCACPPAGSPIDCNDDSCGLQSVVTASVTAGNCYKIRLGSFGGAAIQGILSVGCEVPPTTGACCEDATGTCTATNIESDCIALGGHTWNGGADCATFSCPVPLAGDECVDAISLLCDSSNVVDNTLATDDLTDPDPTCDSNLFNSLWYSFVATDTSALVVTDNVAGGDTTYALYDSCGGAEVATGCSSDEGAGFLGNICVTGLTAGNTYIIQFGTWSAGDAGVYQLDITCPCPGPPANDNCIDKITITDGTTTFDTANATTDGPASPAGCGSNVHNDIWYNYTATCTGDLTVSTCNTASFDTKIAIYDTCVCPTDNTQLLTCNDDGSGCSGFTSIATTTVTSGQCYKIRVGGFGSSSAGSGDLVVGCVPGPFCGDGNIDPGEQCDPPDGTTCDATCQDIPQGTPCPGGHADCAGVDLAACTVEKCDFDPANPLCFTTAFLQGDIDKDGSPGGLADLLLLLNIAGGTGDPTDPNADLDGDGAPAGLGDLLILLNISGGGTAPNCP